MVEKEDVTFIEQIEYVLSDIGEYKLDENKGMGYILESYSTARNSREGMLKEISKAKKVLK